MTEKKSNYISIGDASVLSGLCLQTLRKLADNKKISSYKTDSGQRKFSKTDILQMCSNGLNNEILEKKKNYIYTRINSKETNYDINKQLEYIKLQKKEYNSYIIISDIDTGVEFKREGLSVILDSCLNRTVGEIVIAHCDRLSIFGYDLIESIIKKSGGIIINLNNNNYKGSSIEISEELLYVRKK